jgi:DNA-directed RNA polymerase subunit RPC12/RpoP
LKKFPGKNFEFSNIAPKLWSFDLYERVVGMGIEESEKHMEMWDFERNPGPNGIGFYNQSRRYWWKCGACGKDWEAFVISITRRKGIGCRKCISKESGYIDFTNRMVGRWQVIKKLDNDKGSGSLWLAKCLGCDEEHRVRGDNLRAGMTNKCVNCHKKETMKLNPIPWSFWKSMIDGAKNRGIEFGISMEDAYNILLDQDFRCALTGDELILISDSNGHLRESKNYDNYASLDRIDSGAGYTVNNLQWVRKDINLLKGKISQDKFIDLCKMVAKHLK